MAAMIVEDDACENSIWSEPNYKKWKKNSKYLYETLVAHELEGWPSLTVDWFQGSTVSMNGDKITQKLVIGTQTNDEGENYVKVVKLARPLMEKDAIQADKFNHKLREVGKYGADVKLETTITMLHEGDVNVARINPNNEFLIATMTPTGSVLVFDYSKHPSFPADKDFVCHPQFRCNGHEKEGFALSWCPHTNARLLSGAEDGKVCVWDVPRVTGKAEVTVDPTYSQTSHTCVNDVAWHAKYANIFGSVGDDSKVVLHDPRTDSSSSRPAWGNAHAGKAVQSLSFNPYNEYLLATGGADDCVALWDLRYTEGSLHKINDCHSGGVDRVMWCPQRETVLATCGTMDSANGEHSVKVWDIAKIGEEQNDDDEMDGPPELLFSHVGHMRAINDMRWCPGEAWMLASVDASNYLHVWEMDEANRGANPSVATVADEDLE